MCSLWHCPGGRGHRQAGPPPGLEPISGRPGPAGRCAGRPWLAGNGTAGASALAHASTTWCPADEVRIRREKHVDKTRPPYTSAWYGNNSGLPLHKFRTTSPLESVRLVDNGAAPSTTSARRASRERDCWPSATWLAPVVAVVRWSSRWLLASAKGRMGHALVCGAEARSRIEWAAMHAMNAERARATACRRSARNAAGTDQQPGRDGATEFAHEVRAGKGASTIT
ncbi:hypothetical protein [Rhodoferax sp.]|uniref:hypothetical protein n=1 Tax=Rhodoferax sp. TaxID=50421 RepID=UPI002ACE50AB|nr:hypothetical protein [Rhodoferax sp.]MDZ7918906.1 hypothetical protein [Rhodoferax sp.]